MNRRGFLLSPALALPYSLRAQGRVPRVGGVLTIETLGAGDPREKVPKFIQQIRAVFTL